MEPRRRALGVVLRLTAVALGIGVIGAAGAFGIGQAVSGNATAATGIHSTPAGADAPTRRSPNTTYPIGYPSEPPAAQAPSDGPMAWYTLSQIFANVPNGQERILKCPANYPFILSGFVSGIPPAFTQIIANHPVYDNPDGWAGSARYDFGFLANFRIDINCTDKPRG